MSKYEKLAKELKRKPKKWLVTGAAGFIGCNLVLRLLELNQKVIALDNYATGEKKNIDEIRRLKNKKFQFIRGDIQNDATNKKALKGVHYVLHQAAIGSVPRSIKDPLYSHDSNVNGFVHLLKAALDAKVKKFVYASSSSVYGDHPDLPKVEDKTGNVLSPYAATKAMDEYYAEVFHRVYNAPVVGLRYFNVFGPRQNPKGPYAAVIPLWVDAMLKKKKVYINGDGSYSRDFCFIENVMQANILAAMSDQEAENRAYNIAYGDRTTLLELFDAIKSALENAKPNLKIPPPVHRDFRDGDIPHSHANVDLARHYLGYDPVIRVRDGLKYTVDYILYKNL